MTGSLIRTMKYAGLSSMISTSADGQKTSQLLCIDQGSKVKANLTIEDKTVVMGLRAFTSVLYNL